MHRARAWPGDRSPGWKPELAIWTTLGRSIPESLREEPIGRATCVYTDR